jgi:hypothetical protein
LVEKGTLRGDDPHRLSGADGTIWHPSGRWASTVVRLAGGQMILDADELVGIWPSNGGHHDCVIVPRNLEDMKHTRSCTLQLIGDRRQWLALALGLRRASRLRQ